MKVKPVLDDWEIPRVSSVKTLESRVSGEMTTRIAIAGSLYGDEARDDFLETVRDKYRKGQPVIFAADIVNTSDVQYVFIETMVFQESGIRPDQTDYIAVLRQSPPPSPQHDSLSDIDAMLVKRGQEFVNLAASGGSRL